MGKLVVIFEAPGMTSEQYDVILKELGEKEASANQDRPVHLAFQKADGWCVIDVWESEEALKDFAEKNLIPAFQKLGIPPLQPKIIPLYRFVNAEEVISN